MLTLLKKLFTPPPKLKSSTLNEVLISQLTSLVDNFNLNTLFYSPESKLYILNTYTSSFNELTSLITSNTTTRQLSSINIHAYFNSSTVDIRSQLTRLITYLSSNKISSMIEHDLFELCNAYYDLTHLE